MVDVQSNTIGHVLPAHLAGVVVPSRYLLAQLFSHQLPLVASMVIPERRFVVNGGEAVSPVHNPVPAHGHHAIVHGHLVGRLHVVPLPVACLLTARDKLERVRVVECLGVLPLPALPQAAGLQVFLLLRLPLLDVGSLRDYLFPVGGLEHKAIYQVVDLHVASAGDIEPLDEVWVVKGIRQDSSHQRDDAADENNRDNGRNDVGKQIDGDEISPFIDMIVGKQDGSHSLVLASDDRPTQALALLPPRPDTTTQPPHHVRFTKPNARSILVEAKREHVYGR